ncbi:DUF4439 domain-containing protein [Arthrobacter sp. OY3WO11]|uniref:DUF4439 domain-containing protein n=1 Tax=Arthrobacter sp. OY3WO11 TaxID=1835723 RepID=UPI0007CFD678|nr:DUF4439 domain-containing protein [Arthrobacter sp. OY3WO11]OAE01370.1 hypothetical protein A6A22_07995 [Arthrobacter sp. OY3WO11]
MKEDDPENRPKLRYFRYAVISFTALIVLSLGFSLIPADPPAPADPPISEQARAAALQDSLDLRAAAGRLSAVAAARGDANPAAADQTVTLLTLQARALLSTADSSPAEDVPASATPLPSGQSGPAAGAATTAEPTFAGLASALSASGVQRLTDAAKVDGGMARLLAGAGTAQLLAAEDLAAAAGVAAETLPHSGSAALPAAGPSAPAPVATASACPSPLPAPGVAGQEPTSTGTSAVLGSALSAAVTIEQQSMYAYQAALPRLGAGDAPAAEAFLGQHRELAAEAAAYALAACSTPQPQQPGFVLGPDFLATPGDGLARLESEALPAYGDVIARADGGLRAWAIAALQSAARRTAHWNGGVGPVPGLLLDQDQLPELPASPAPASAGSRGPARP